MTDPEAFRAVREYLVALVESSRARDQAQEALELRLEGEGYRLVESGGAPDGRWAIVDWRTSEVLAEGSDDANEYDAAWKRFESSGKPLWDVDRVIEEAYDAIPILKAPPTLPPGLGRALKSWVGDDIEEAADWLLGLMKSSQDAAAAAEPICSCGDPLHGLPPDVRLPCGCTDTSAGYVVRPDNWCDAHRCTAIKRDGGRCTNRAREMGLCGVHRVKSSGRSRQVPDDSLAP